MIETVIEFGLFCFGAYCFVCLGNYILATHVVSTLILIAVTALDDKLLFSAGLIFFTLGIVFLCKVWWSLTFNFSSNMNAATYVALVLVSFMAIWIGMAMIGQSFGLISVASWP